MCTLQEAREHAPAAVATKLSDASGLGLLPGSVSLGVKEDRRQGSALLGPLSSPPAGDRRTVWL